MGNRMEKGYEIETILEALQVLLIHHCYYYFFKRNVLYIKSYTRTFHHWVEELFTKLFSSFTIRIYLFIY